MSKEPQRLHFLDGLRGLAALYVALFHNVWEYAKDLGSPYGLALGWLRHGGYAVDVFIVLSGFCLMRPVVQPHAYDLKGGLSGFFYRRAKRILPPYFGALFATWLLLLLSSEGVAMVHGNPVSAAWLLNFNLGNVISHLLLIHNWDSRWNMSINFPMWSVATEWQIYFVFALLLLPLARRWGMGVAGAFAFVLGLVPRLILPAGRNGDWAAPWLLGLFYLGMLAAVIAFSDSPQVARFRRSVSWGKCCLALFALLLMWQYVECQAFWYIAVEANLVGIIAGCLILSCMHAVAVGQPNWAIRLMETRVVLFLGMISYSLYLTHVPAMFKVFPLMNALKLSAETGLIFRIFFGVPWMLGVAALFYFIVERHFVANGINRKSAGRVSETQRSRAASAMSGL